MNPVLLAALTSISTSLGGLFTLRTKDRFHLVLGLSAGLLLGLVAFDLNPTIYAHMGITWGGLPASHILPEAHANHPSRFTMGATALGVLIMWVVVRTLG
jgi:uncharacterized transporter YbjL